MLSVVTMGIVSIFIALFFPARQASQAEAATTVVANAVADFAAHALAKPIRTGDRTRIDEILRATMMHEGVEYAFVLDARGIVVVMHERTSRLYDAASESRARAGFSSDDLLFRTRRSLIGENGSDLLGTLYVGYGLDQLHATILSSRIVAAVIGVLVFLFGLAAASAISHYITEPLGRLARAAERLCDGDFSARVMVNTRDEIGRMAETFNGMADSLQAALTPGSIPSDPTEVADNHDADVRTGTATYHVAEAVSQSEAQFQSAAGYANSCVVVLDRDDRSRGLVRFASPPLRRLLGYEASELLGADFVSLLHPEDRSSVVHVLGEAENAAASALIVRVRRSDDTWKRVSLHRQFSPPGNDADDLVLSVRDLDNDTRLLRAVSEKLRARASRQRAK